MFVWFTRSEVYTSYSHAHKLKVKSVPNYLPDEAHESLMPSFIGRASLFSQLIQINEFIFQ